MFRRTVISQRVRSFRPIFLKENLCFLLTTFILMHRGQIFLYKVKGQKILQKIDERKKKNKLILRTYCLIEHELRVIDDSDTCGLIERRGTCC